MALYQPSFCVPHNQAIDATDQDDMTFSFKLNGNNPLVAYNIQIYDNDTNKLVYELISIENERAIQAKIQEISNWLAIQHTKYEKLENAEEEYDKSEIKTNFRTQLRKAMVNEKKKLLTMEETLSKKNKGETLGQTEITKYFEYFGNILTDLNSLIGDEENPLPNTGEYILNTITDWVNVDPARKDGVEYEDEDKVIIDRKAFNNVKEIYISIKQYYENVMKARTGASDTTYINETTYNKARQAAYLIYSEFSNEPYFNKDLYEAINTVWNNTNFDKLLTEVTNYEALWTSEITQQEYALSHLSGGKTTNKVNVYNSPTASESNIYYSLQKGAQVAIIKSSSGEPPAGWYFISSGGQFGYIQSQYVQLYNIKSGKYYLEKPIYPTNYEGEKNTIYHQLPINILSNGKSYKWSVTLYWSTSGRYDEESKIDGSLTSVENYFETRKKPIVKLKNINELFTIPFNYVNTTTDMMFTIDDDGTSISLPKGSSVRIITLIDEDTVNIEYVDENTNLKHQAIISVNNIDGLGLYGSSNNYILPSKKATFEGYYEQEQFVSISYFRWVLYKLQYDSEEISEVVKDTGMIPSIDFRFSYDGFLNDEKYGIKIFVQTLDNIEAETELIKFKVSYIDYEIENMLNAENSPIEHGIIVEWSNLRLIKGEVEGNSHYEKDTPTENKTALTLENNKTTLTFDKDKGKPLSVDFDANQILCTRFDEERPLDKQIYYTASGLDDNGEVVSKTLELIPTNDTQTTGKVILRYTIKTAIGVEEYDKEIIASALYWYVIIMKKDGFVVFTKYAQGLFPAIDQYPNLNKFTGQKGLYPDALTYLEEPSDRVEYNYQTIVDRDGNEIKKDGENG